MLLVLALRMRVNAFQTTRSVRSHAAESVIGVKHAVSGRLVEVEPGEAPLIATSKARMRLKVNSLKLFMPNNPRSVPQTAFAANSRVHYHHILSPVFGFDRCACVLLYPSRWTVLAILLSSSDYAPDVGKHENSENPEDSNSTDDDQYRLNVDLKVCFSFTFSF